MPLRVTPLDPAGQPIGPSVALPFECVVVEVGTDVKNLIEAFTRFAGALVRFSAALTDATLAALGIVAPAAAAAYAVDRLGVTEADVRRVTLDYPNGLATAHLWNHRRITFPITDVLDWSTR